MGIMRDVVDILIAASVPSALVGFLFWWIEGQIKKREAERQKEREESKAEARRLGEAKVKNEILTIELVSAALELCEATAKAVQRIPDAHCNGDMDAALARAAAVRSKHDEFVVSQGINAMY